MGEGGMTILTGIAILSLGGFIGFFTCAALTVGRDADGGEG